MGHVYARVTLVGTKPVKMKMLVDTGATCCLVPPDIARRAGLEPTRRSFRMRLANGKIVRVGGDLGTVRIDDREAPATILVGAAAEPILGVEALEALGLTVDVKRGRLRATRHYTIRLGGYR